MPVTTAKVTVLGSRLHILLDSTSCSRMSSEAAPEGVLDKAGRAQAGSSGAYRSAAPRDAASTVPDSTATSPPPGSSIPLQIDVGSSITLEARLTAPKGASRGLAVIDHRTYCDGACLAHRSVRRLGWVYGRPCRRAACPHISCARRACCYIQCTRRPRQRRARQLDEPARVRGLPGARGGVWQRLTAGGARGDAAPGKAGRGPTAGVYLCTYKCRMRH